jgi:hypothetical protein
MPKLHRQNRIVSAALGWQAGNATEAKAELDGLPADLRCPEVIRPMGGRSEAKGLGKLPGHGSRPDIGCPGRTGWLDQASYSLHELKRTREAWDSLAVVSNPHQHYSAQSCCYACQLGDSPEAMRRLGKALKLGGKDQIKAMSSKISISNRWDDTNL